MMYASLSDLNSAKARVDLTRQHRNLPEDLGGVLGGVDCLLQHLLTKGEFALACGPFAHSALLACCLVLATAT